MDSPATGSRAPICNSQPARRREAKANAIERLLFGGEFLMPSTVEEDGIATRIHLQVNRETGGARRSDGDRVPRTSEVCLGVSRQFGD